MARKLVEKETMLARKRAAQETARMHRVSMKEKENAQQKLEQKEWPYTTWHSMPGPSPIFKRYNESGQTCVCNRGWS